MISRRTLLLACLGLSISILPAAAARGQEKSVKPGVNKPYDKPNVEKTAKSYERENRDVVEKRDEIVAACQLKPGMTVADIGAGTGLFTRPFAAKVKPGGTVLAVDITGPFLKHIEKTCRQQGIDNVKCQLCTPTSAELKPDSIDLAFTCDTYHHFEFPFKMLASINKALRPGGRLIIVDYKKEKGVSKDWVMGHVRADQKTVIKEAADAGFKFIDEVDLMKAQYVLRFEKVE